MVASFPPDPAPSDLDDAAGVGVRLPLDDPAHAVIYLLGSQASPDSESWRHVERVRQLLVPTTDAGTIAGALSDAIARTAEREDADGHIERVVIPMDGGEVVITYGTGGVSPLATPPVTGSSMGPQTYAIIEFVPQGASPVVPPQPTPTPFRLPTPSPARTPTRVPTFQPPPTLGPMPSPGSLDGTWTVDPMLGSFDYDMGDFSGSWVGYRVQQQLVRVGGSEAVGRTPEVTGSLTIDGTTITDASFEADLTSLESDEPRRDAQLGSQGIETDEFPIARLVLTEPIELGELPAVGQDREIDAVGDLTIHGVTKGVTIPLHVALHDGVIAAAGSLTFGWDDFGMEPPTAARVVSLADELTLEAQLFFTREATAPTPAPTPGPSLDPAAEVLEVTLLDSMEIQPRRMTVGTGRPVRFVVTNEGTLEHSFFLGSDREQRRRGSGQGEPGPDRYVEVPPGETRTLTYTFPSEGRAIAGCVVPGHYSAGMKAFITIV